jgi:uncharacterized protein YbjT (DUF2867 family)
MRILLLGASGFIGRELFAALVKRRHRVVAAVRDLAAAPPFAGEPAVLVDLNQDTNPVTWLSRVAGIDAVVNCAGVLQGSRAQSIESIHRAAPVALFKACEIAGVRRVVQISAISADRQAGTAYALTKLAADDYLRSTSLEWVVVRPSLVHARGAYGGTALLRALAALPFAIPVPGDGDQEFQPIHVDDLARVIAQALETDRLVRQTVDPVGPEVVTLRAILHDYRRWLGFGRAPIVSIPDWIVKAAVRLGDVIGGPLNSTALAQLEHGNTGDYAAFVEMTGLEARGWWESLALQPAHTQDRWHARLYFVRPALRFTLAFLWLASALAGFFALREWGALLSTRLALDPIVATPALGLACGADLVLAALLIARWRPRALALIQVLVIAGYTAVATLLWPALWAQPLGALFKNVPILAAVLALGAIEEER